MTGETSANEDLGLVWPLMQTFFEADGWPTESLEGETALRAGFEGANGQWVCYAQAQEPQRQCLFYSVLPEVVPEAIRPAAGELVARANYGLVIGNFEMNWDTGMVRFKTSLDVQGEPLTLLLFRNLVYANVLTMDKYLPAIQSVLHEGVPPADALRFLRDGAALG